MHKNSWIWPIIHHILIVDVAARMLEAIAELAVASTREEATVFSEFAVDFKLGSVFIA